MLLIIAAYFEAISGRNGGQIDLLG